MWRGRASSRPAGPGGLAVVPGRLDEADFIHQLVQYIACRSKAAASAAAATASYHNPACAKRVARRSGDAALSAAAIVGSTGVRSKEALATMSRDRALGLRMTDTDQV